MAYRLKELSAGRSPWRIGFGADGGRASVPYVCSYDTVDDLEQMIIDVLGTTKRTGDGSLDRSLPKAHPRHPFLYAVSMDIQGAGYRDADGDVAEVVDAEAELEAPTIDSQYLAYVREMVTIEYRTLPWAVLSNTQIITVSDYSWTKEDGTDTSSKMSAEWNRYVDWGGEPRVDVAHAQHGQLRYWNLSGSPPDTFPFSGHPRVMMPNGTLTARWMQVPFSYVESSRSPLVKYVGYVNQFQWLSHPPGSLLFMGAKVVRRYTPPVPERTKLFDTTAFSISKLCDLDLMFTKTTRTTDDVPVFSPANENWIPQGHNTQPFLKDRKFYYVGDGVDQTPVHLSVPFQLLWVDPDA